MGISSVFKQQLLAGSALFLALTVGYAPYAAAHNNDIHIADKSITLENGIITEPTYRDGDGREVYFRGWNVSGSVKLVETGFKPFMNTEDAAASFQLMAQHAGSNLVRFTIAWEGVHPEVGIIDYTYLDAVVAQMREAIKRDIYLFVDYHTDLYSRYLFSVNSKQTGNGAPKWIIDGSEYPAGGCGIICFSWSQNNVTNKAVRKAYQNFFDNAPISTTLGERFTQDEFLYQMSKALGYIKSQLTEEEFRFVLGVQPFNEPIYGVGHKNRADEYDNEKLWPFYQRARAVLDAQGWNTKWVYAEPMVFWDTNAGFFTPPTGGHYLKEKPGAGFVFAPHFYDAARMGVSNLERVENADYFENLDTIRDEARFLGIPAVLGEYGMWLLDQDGGSKDYQRVVKATYQAMESSDINRTEKDRHIDFYTTVISGTQWHWDIYKDQHHELRNGNPNKVITHGDGWNDEDFSAIKTDQLTVDPAVIRRAYPRRVQGDLVSFYYNELSTDGAGIQSQWAGIKPAETILFKDKTFALLIWQSNADINAPTELFLPVGFLPENTSIISDLGFSQNLSNSLTTSQGFIAMEKEWDEVISGYRLTVQATENDSSEQRFHYALVVQNSDQTEAQLAALQQQMTQAISEERNPVYLTGQMVSAIYPEEIFVQRPVDITDVSEIKFFTFRWVTIRWAAEESVVILKNGEQIADGKASGKKRVYSKIGSNDTLQVCLASDHQACSKPIVLY